MRILPLISILKNIDTGSERRLMEVWEWLKDLKKKVNEMRHYNPRTALKEEKKFLKFVQPGRSQSNILAYGIVPRTWEKIKKEVYHLRFKSFFKLIIEVNRQAKNFSLFWSCPNQGFFKKINGLFEPYEKLGDIFDPEHWNDDFHKEVEEESVEWVWRQVVPRLALNDSLSLEERFVPLTTFSKRMRRWLLIANEHKKYYPLNSS